MSCADSKTIEEIIKQVEQLLAQLFELLDKAEMARFWLGKDPPKFKGMPYQPKGWDRMDRIRPVPRRPIK